MKAGQERCFCSYGLLLVVTTGFAVWGCAGISQGLQDAEDCCLRQLALS
jgi:hypothetical protein